MADSVLTHLSLQHPYELGTVVILISQMMKLKYLEIN